MGQKNKLCSSSIEWITMWSPNIRRQLGAYMLRMVWRNVWRGEVVQNCLNKILFGPEPAARPVHDRKY